MYIRQKIYTSDYLGNVMKMGNEIKWIDGGNVKIHR